jgi:hypothetical protein
MDSETVVNKKTFKGSAILIGRPSVFGNPFSHLAHSRAEVNVPDRYTAITRFANWLITGNDPDIRRSPQPIRDAIRRGELDNELPLMCFCAPLACHGDVLDEIRTAEILATAIADPHQFLRHIELRILAKC